MCIPESDRTAVLDSLCALHAKYHSLRKFCFVNASNDNASKVVELWFKGGITDWPNGFTALKKHVAGLLGEKEVEVCSVEGASILECQLAGCTKLCHRKNNGSFAIGCSIKHMQELKKAGGHRKATPRASQRTAQDIANSTTTWRNATLVALYLTEEKAQMLRTKTNTETNSLAERFPTFEKVKMMRNLVLGLQFILQSVACVQFSRVYV